MPQIIDQYGKPLDRKVLGQPQTSQVRHLRSAFLQPMLGGLSPARIAAILQQADNGDITAQHRLFADMEDRDAHLLAEINKRKLELLTIDWDIVPPRNASFQEKKTAAWLKEVLTDAVDPIEDLILALMDGPGHGFAAAELAWSRQGEEWLPSFHPRPQEWFTTASDSLRLRDGSFAGAELIPFGWVLHTHGKPKTGYLGRLGLYRAVIWPFLYKFYSISDLAEFLEVYGLPIIVGKYFANASEEEKSTLLQAVVSLGHDARAIMPQEMAIEIEKVSGGASGSPHLEMVDWCERSQSKAILGQVLSAEAKATGMGSGTANLHGEVRHDILAADARQIGATLTRDLCYPLIALNRGIDGLQRCPRFVFDTSRPQDLNLFADALPKLAAVKMRIPVAWAHDKLKIPLGGEDEAVLGAAESPADLLVDPASTPPPEGLPGGKPPRPPAALAALSASDSDPTPASTLADRLQGDASGAWKGVLDHIRQMVDAAESLEGLQASLLAAYDGLPLDDLRAVMASGFAVARLAGMSDVEDESAPS